MENIIEKRQEALDFLRVDEFPDGSGSGSGYGSGDGYGSGSGDGSGSGYGDGSGYGSGSGIECINGQRVYKIDIVPTLIDSVHGNYAKGKVLGIDLTTKECYIAKMGNYFAHGETLREALADVTEKYEQNLPIEERLAKFMATYPDYDKKVPANELFSWHHVLTGSCLMGRKGFCEQHRLDYVNGSYSVNEFIELTKNAYGGEIIRRLVR